MKVFFGDALQEMMTELRGQGVASLRVHVLPQVEGDALVLRTHVTTFCNNQIYECVLEARESLHDVAQEQRDAFIREACARERRKLAERLPGFELRHGILQE